MQTRMQSILEVSIDFAFSLVINIVGQLVFYPDLATLGRVTLFASLVLALAFARRLATRCLFESCVPAGTRQSRWHSVCESVMDTVLGLAITVTLQMLIYGDAATFLRASSLTIGIYGLTMVRRYYIRRLFVVCGPRIRAGGA